MAQTRPSCVGTHGGLQSERAFFDTWMQHIVPSLQHVDLAAAARLVTPVLTIHARQDRSAPYGGGREWSQLLPNGRLLTIDGAGPMPWIEQPAAVFAAAETFLAGEWRADAEQVPQ